MLDAFLDLDGGGDRTVAGKAVFPGGCDDFDHGVAVLGLDLIAADTEGIAIVMTDMRSYVRLASSSAGLSPG